MARLGRLTLTGLAVVLGVTFVTGSYALTDTLGDRFGQVVAQVNAGIDVLVRSQAGFAGADTVEKIPGDLVGTVAAVPGVAVAQGQLAGGLTLIGPDGRPVRPSGGPRLAFSWVDVPGLTAFGVAEGRPPAGPGEVAIDRRTARTLGVGVGDEIGVGGLGTPTPYRIVGLVSFGEAESLAGGTIAVFDLPTTQAVLGTGDVVDTVLVRAAEGVDPAELAARIQTLLPGDLQAVTAGTVAEENAADLDEGLGFVNRALLFFAGLGVFVGAFIIANTFTVLVSQRQRELGLLRALGAGRGQVAASVLGEAAGVGLLASVAGIALGMLVATGLLRIVSATLFELPPGPVVLAPRTVVVALVVGVGTTMVAAMVPARRAARVPPVAAMSLELASTQGRPLRRRAIAGALTAAVGMAVLAFGALVRPRAGTDFPVYVVGLGALVTFAGVVLAGPALARPLGLALARPLRAVLGVPGTLAGQNAARMPHRTAATASALTIGLSLVVLVAVIATSVEASLGQRLQRRVDAELVIRSEQAAGFSPDLLDGLAGSPAFSAVVGARVARVSLEGDSEPVLGADPAALAQVSTLPIVDGADPGELQPGEILLSLDWSAGRTPPVEVGDVVDVAFASAPPGQVRVAGLFAGRMPGPDGGISVLATPDLLDTAGASANLNVAYLRGAEGVSLDEQRQIAQAAVSADPSVRVEELDGLLAQRRGNADRLLAVIYALLGLAVLIALIGIVNTLLLAVLERTREIGLLRAVGTSRRQVRVMVIGESGVIAVLGVGLGVTLGLVFGWGVVTVLADEGIGTFAVPVRQILWYAVLAVLAGLAAGLLPARRAARLDILDAIAVELLTTGAGRRRGRRRGRAERAARRAAGGGPHQPPSGQEPAGPTGHAAGTARPADATGAAEPEGDAPVVPGARR